MLRLLFNGSHEGNQTRTRTLILIATFAMSTFIFSFIFLLTLGPNRQLKAGYDDSCTILKAEVACWRRYSFSSRMVEDGKYTCWHFTVKTSNFTSEVQYEDIDDFPITNDKCSTEERCGLESWPCRVAPGNGSSPPRVVLRWSYPTKEIVGLVVALLFVFVFAVIAGLRSWNVKTCFKGNRSDCEVCNSDITQEDIRMLGEDQKSPWASSWSKVSKFRSKKSSIIPAPAAQRLS